MFRNILAIMVLTLIMVGIATAATIQGTVYDLSLNKVSKSIVEVDSTPNQRLVTIEGKYSFNLPKGNYIITASANGEFAKENISIADEGTYNLDLFLFPSLDEDITQDISIDVLNEDKNQTIYYIIIAAALFLITAFAAYKFRHKLQKKEAIEKLGEPPENMIDDKIKIINIIRRHGNRTTQKDIRKEISFSEAKVSLVIAELEHEGMVKKIKKGRGNIIILNEQNNQGS